MPRKSESRGGSQEEITRCLCGNEVFVITPRTRALNANPGLFVQCERCHVWQHGFCMGFASEDQVPDIYYCEQCEPSFHRLLNRGGIPTSRYRPHAGALAESHHDDSETSIETTTKPDKPKVNISDNSEKHDTNDTNDAHDAPLKDEKQDDVSIPEPEETSPDEPVESQTTELAAETAEETNQDHKEADKPEKKDNDKKRRRRNSDAEFTRNRRRFRESEILQMVLEESAREAEEAARKQNGSAIDEDDKKDDKLDKRKRSSSPVNQLELAAPDLTDETEPEDARKRKNLNSNEPKRRARTVRRGSRRGMTARTAREPQTPTRRNKPRLPSSRSTLGEMIRRVAAILEFSSRAQSELSTESTNDIPLMRASELSPDLTAKVDALEKVYAKNIAGLENLTRQLLEWDERFNK